MECGRSGNEGSHPVVVVVQQTPDIDATDSSILPSGRVTEIRRQWALHEDEALAYRLQTEEISQHYTGNRSRNAIVREDGPKAREEQKKEEQEALELRFHQLSVLQHQAEEDSRFAKLIAEREGQKLLNNRLQGNGDVVFHREQDDDRIGASSSTTCNNNNSELDFDILDKIEDDEIGVVNKSANSTSSSSGSSSGAAVPSTSSACRHRDRDRSGCTKLGSLDNSFDLSEDELRYLQQEKDEVLARHLQDEIEQFELDRKLAVEAQDRELAKVIYEKEKARLKRAKERARLKAAAAAANECQSEIDNQKSDSRSQSLNSPTPSSSSSSQMRSSPSSSSTRRAQSSPNSTTSFQLQHDNNSLHIPPKIPEKTVKSNAAGITKDDPIGFRANPKPLPPQPESQQPTNCRSDNVDARNVDPIPPYMPMQGFNNNTRITPTKKK